MVVRTEPVSVAEGEETRVGQSSSTVVMWKPKAEMTLLVLVAAITMVKAAMAEWSRSMEVMLWL